jgi:hypothetical protein
LTFSLPGVISGALLYIRDDFAAVEKSTVLRVHDNISHYARWFTFNFSSSNIFFRQY